MLAKSIHSLSLGAVLFAVWLLLSGHYTPFIMSLGIGSCALVVLVTLRMDVADHEGHPIHLTWRGLTYWPWLMIEIFKANIDVAKLILSPNLGITPTLIRVKASQTSDLGQVIYANSITLTPGTISIDVANGEILVHALSREGAEALLDGEMDRRVTRMVGEDR
ncbi:MAG: Na+/H+ antiporter subunit E [Proteobacteria bacterium]|nr:Na+/H+ antiporter subunit E [Pseudomonadota bacterium]MDA1323569.1 Na+/H+ antiporter subunit E [Pseudomonadota bacterium]